MSRSSTPSTEATGTFAGTSTAVPVSQASSRSSLLTPADDLSPRLSISGNGDTWVAWFREGATRAIYIDRYDYSAGSWSGEERVSELDESSQDPSLVNDGTNVWVAYAFVDGAGTGIAVAGGVDEPTPFPGRTVITTTPHTDVQVAIHSESNALWVTWVDSSTAVGWSAYDGTVSAWGTVSVESYALDSVAEARSRIRATVLAE